DGSFRHTSQSGALPTTQRPLSWNSSPVCGPSSGTNQPTAEPMGVVPWAAASMAIVRILGDGVGAGAGAAAASGALPPAPQYGHWSQLGCSFCPQLSQTFFFEKRPIFFFPALALSLAAP